MRSDHSLDDLGELVRSALSESFLEHVNLLIVGRTGVGKGTLINAVFQGDYAHTGQGLPVTMSTEELSKEGIPFTIIDSRGLELSDYEQTLEALQTFVQARQESSDVDHNIHFGWLCIQEPGRRVEDAEIALLEFFKAHGVPVIVVITKAVSDQGFCAKVESILPQAEAVISVNSIEMVLDDGRRIPPSGLEQLVSVTMDMIPEKYRQTFAVVQRVSLQEKVSRAHRAVAGFAAASTAIGAQPLPFADAVALVPIQISMLVKITHIFGLDLTEGFIAALVASAAGTTAATFAGKTLVSSLFKLVPGAGTLVGGALGGATAGLMTTALGEAYILTLRLLYEESDGDDPPSPELVAERFKTELKQWPSR